MTYYRNRIMYRDSIGGLVLELFHNPNIYLYDKLEECKALYEELNMIGLEFDNTLYYPFSDLEILKEFKRIKTLSISTSNINNFDGLKYAPELKKFAFSSDKKLDFSVLADRIEDLSVYYHKKITNLETLQKVVELSIYNDNNTVILPENIEELKLVQSKRTDFEGLHHLKKLKDLEFHYCPKIESLDTIPTILEKIHIESCSRLVNFEGLFNLQNPESITIRSKYVSKDLELRFKMKFPTTMVDVKKVR